jgi:hypothetical protein
VKFDIPDWLEYVLIVVIFIVVIVLVLHFLAPSPGMFNQVNNDL